MTDLQLGGELRSVHGNLALQLLPPRTSVPQKELTLREILKYGTPQPGLPREVNEWRLKNQRYLWRGGRRVLAARALGIAHMYGQLSLMVGRCRCGEPERHLAFALEGKSSVCPEAEWFDYGLASLRVVTTAGVNFIVDAFQNSVEVENLKFHGIGTGTNAEASGDTALQTELTTQYNPDNTRATGSTTEGGSANVYRTVGTNTVDASAAVTEHGIFSQAATGGGTLLDRSVFSVINLANGDSIQATYDLTFSAGG